MAKREDPLFLQRCYLLSKVKDYDGFFVRRIICSGRSGSIWFFQTTDLDLRFLVAVCFTFFEKIGEGEKD